MLRIYLGKINSLEIIDRPYRGWKACLANEHHLLGLSGKRNFFARLANKK